MKTTEYTPAVSRAHRRHSAEFKAEVIAACLQPSHSGRRIFATTLIEKGVGINAVSTLMGHSSVSMTSQYVENNPTRLKQICTDLF
ncbi:tyrosine-type recombinase/integrase [Collimonas sp.]|jgi:integrase/recombinase XerD|uniref:tyrosine-type recombinase/integrase n=1 Tax=Collimonas sp. TaxID=1963772 RepID=UPI0037BE5AE6